ncbi:MAG: hypothetical protein DI537_42415, partial [Stutzerimonas stutzeri]
MRLHHLTEARKPAPPAPVDFSALLDRLKRIAAKLAGHPFDIDWDYRYGNSIKKKVEMQIADHNASFDDGEEVTPLDERDLYIEFLPYEWRNLIIRSFAAVKNEIAHDILAYQKRHGERLDREAGHESDMHFIEDSDWLRAMEMQKRAAETITHSSVSAGSGISMLVDRIEAFTDDWPQIRQSEQGDEAV